MNVLDHYVSFEEKIKNSTFLSELIVCTSQNEAREIIKQQKSKYVDARHVVHAFVIGSGAEVCGMSDDGEPSGTAGRPVLDVLKGHGCTNTLLTITRWFGGTLLGTGGLVKAYGGGAKQVLAKADEEGAFVPLIAKNPFSFSVDYGTYKIVKKFLEDFNIFELSEDFGTDVTLKGQIQADEYEVFSARLTDVTNGKVKLN